MSDVNEGRGEKWSSLRTVEFNCRRAQEIRERLGVHLRELGELMGLERWSVKHRESGRIAIVGFEALIYEALDLALRANVPLRVWGTESLSPQERLTRIFYLAFGERLNVLPTTAPQSDETVKSSRRSPKNQERQRRKLFERWSLSTNDEGRRTVEQTIRIRFPAGSRFAFTIEEIATFNRAWAATGRSGGIPFNPYQFGAESSRDQQPKEPA